MAMFLLPEIAEGAAALAESQVARFAAGAGLSKGVVNALSQVAGNAAHMAVHKMGEPSLKRPRTDATQVKTEVNADPQNHEVFKPSGRPFVGGNSLYSGGEVVERPLSLSCGKPVQSDVLKAFLSDFLGTKRYKSQFGLQYVGDDQQRSCQGLLFRHRVTGAFSNAAFRVLKPTTTFLAPTLNGGSGVGTQIAGLPYNFFDVGYGNNMKCMISPVNMMDIENIAAGITPPSARGNYDIWSTSNPFAAASQEDYMDVPYATANLAGSSWVSGYMTNANPVNTNQYRSPSSIVCAARQGGVKLYFENKHVSGAFVEVIQYKLRAPQSEQGIFLPIFNASGPDSVLANLESVCGGAYVDKAKANKASVYGTGHAPAITDVTQSPYYPLLPRTSQKYYGVNSWSERSRTKFALASGHKRMLKVSFGGFKYDPKNLLNSTNDFGESILLVIAVNGQMVSAFAEQSSTGEQLITGDCASGHNMFIRGEYYEDIYPLKVQRAKTLFTQQSMEPRIPVSLTAGVDIYPYQMLPASHALRGADVVLKPGAILKSADGEKDNDVIT